MEANILDVVLVLLLVVYLGEGLRNGLARSVSAIIGILAGGAAAFFAIPLLASWVPSPTWRVVAIVGVSVLLLGLGHAAGAAIGRSIRRRVDDTALRPLDRLGGGVANVVTASLVLALVAGAVGALGVPVLSRATARSQVLRFIDSLTPAPVDAALARIRAAVLEEGLPTIEKALGGVDTSPGVPDVDTGSDALAIAAQSVVRISGTAYACGQNQSGTGFVISDDRIVTNAHVVAGVDEPVVEAPDGQVLDGRIVAFDPDDDLAVIAVDGLNAAPLALDEGLAVGDEAVVDGYPFGGPFTTGPAQVLAVSSERVSDIYGEATVVREVYTLAAEVNPGNSGGPLLALDGEVAGVIFAKSANDDELGYAVTNAELAPVAEAAPGLDASVSAGSCIPG